MVDPDATAFHGSVAIDVDVTDAVDRIVLNALDLTIDAATVAAVGTDARSARVVIDADRERIELHLD